MAESKKIDRNGIRTTWGSNSRDHRDFVLRKIAGVEKARGCIAGFRLPARK
jgi:hypothetical protein